MRNFLNLYLGKRGDALADAATMFSGTLLFLLLHLIWWTWWIGTGVEPFPYGFLTMLLSLEAIVLATLVLMSQNRGAERDRRAAEQDRERHKHIEQIAEHIDVLEQAQMRMLTHLETLAKVTAVRTADGEPG